jgi:hypothetical protein
MVILLHVIIALASIICTSIAYVRPSASMLKAAYSLVGLTVISGTYLVWSAPATMVHACITGLVYIGVVSIGIVAARSKFAHMELTSKNRI